MACRTQRWRKVKEGEEFICYKALAAGLAVLRVPASALTNAPRDTVDSALASEMIYATKFRASQVRVLEIFEYVKGLDGDIQLVKEDDMYNLMHGHATQVLYECGKDLPQVELVPTCNADEPCGLEACGPGYHFFLHWEAAFAYASNGYAIRIIREFNTVSEKVHWDLGCVNIAAVPGGLSDDELDMWEHPASIRIEPSDRVYYEMGPGTIVCYSRFNGERIAPDTCFPKCLNAPYPTEEASAYVRKPPTRILCCPSEGLAEKSKQ